MNKKAWKEHLMISAVGLGVAIAVIVYMIPSVQVDSSYYLPVHQAYQRSQPRLTTNLDWWADGGWVTYQNMFGGAPDRVERRQIGFRRFAGN